MLTSGTPELLHLMGYVTGASLYAMLLAMIVRAQSRTDWLALVTAVLGLAWNVGEMSSHAATALDAPVTSTWLSAASYAALGLLAAVVVHSVTRVRRELDLSSRAPAIRSIAALGYLCAGAAAVLHFVAAARGEPVPSPSALAVVALGLGVLALPLILLTHRQPHGRRALWMTALAVFTVSALHLGRFHGADENWTTELLGHHASIPLAFAILYQDYRFALADLFLKQALILIALVTSVMAVYTTIEPALVTGGLGGAAALLTGWVVTLLLFPVAKRAVTWFVDRVVLSRADYADVLERLSTAMAESRTAEDVLSRACDQLAPALSATSVSWETRTLGGAALAASEIPIWTTDAPQYVLIVGTLAGGRRLLSGDLSMLERAAVLIARRLDALRLTDERYERMLREREMTTLAAEAELRALRAQVNPHFLFNALTTIGYLIQSAPPRALDTLMRLTTLLRGVLRSDGEFTTLGRERELIECYLQIEHERFEERLAVDLDIPSELDDATIPALIVQPLVENAIKHGIARSRTGGLVSVSAEIDATNTTPELLIVVRNTGSAFSGRQPGEDGGVGLQNVERRLQCYYGDGARLTLTRDATGATVATLRLPAIGLPTETATASELSTTL